jgi:hypothetical protein
MSNMASVQPAARNMNKLMTRERFEPKTRSEIHPLAIAPSAIPTGRATEIHLPLDVFQSSPRKCTGTQMIRP